MALLSLDTNLAILLAIPFGVSLIVTVAVTAALIPYLKRINSTQEIYDLAPEGHKVKSGTPTMGGLAILCGITAGCLAAMIAMGFSPTLIVILGMTLAFGGIGMLDDLKKITKRQNLGLKAKHKLMLQIALALAFAIYFILLADKGTYIILPFVWKAINIGPWMYPYIVFIVVAMANAINLTDGLDGLAAGTSFGVSIFFPVFAILGFTLALVNNDTLVEENISQSVAFSMIFPAIAGSCVGFMFFNRYPAKIFMGDTGSLALGGGLAVGAICTHVELLLPIVGFIFMLEAVSVILQVGSYKLRNGKRVFKMAPIHHHFELSGWREKKVVMVFVSITFILCVICAIVLIAQSVSLGETL